MSKSYTVRWFVVSVIDGHVSSDAWLAKWGKPTVAKLAALAAKVGAQHAVVVEQGDVEVAKAALRAQGGV